jgi:hypothetical protein
MRSFAYCTLPGKVLFGFGTIDKVAHEIRQLVSGGHVRRRFRRFSSRSIQRLVASSTRKTSRRNERVSFCPQTQ